MFMNVYTYLLDFHNYLSETIKYTDFHTLQSPTYTQMHKSGSCHDQVAYIFSELSNAGIDAYARFLIEYDSETSDGGVTHSYVYVPDGEYVYWIENAWEDESGVHRFNSVEEIEEYITQRHIDGYWGDIDNYDSVEFSDFDLYEHTYGEDLQTLVDICMNS